MMRRLKLRVCYITSECGMKRGMYEMFTYVHSTAIISATAAAHSRAREEDENRSEGKVVELTCTLS